MRVCVIGAGLFGSLAALKIAQAGHDVDLLERDDDVMQGASKHNHNRIHLGYHYLRSIETAQESREGLATFMEFFGSAVCSEFTNYYAIASNKSYSSPEQFERFCNTVDIKYQPEYPAPRFLARDHLAACYRVPEPVFDYFRVYALLSQQIFQSKATFYPNTEVTGIDRDATGFVVKARNIARRYDAVVNCSYSQLNNTNQLLGIQKKTYLYEDVVIPIFKYEHPMIGLTVMDGEFCSVMPRGLRVNEFLLYHVKHSILNRNLGTEAPRNQISQIDEMRLVDEASVYMPFLKDVELVNRYRCMRVVWENKDDARRSIISNDLPNYWSVLSGKVTTCVSVANELTRRLSV